MRAPFPRPRSNRSWLRSRSSPLYPGHDEAVDGLDPATAPQAIADLVEEIAACDAAVASLSMDAECDVRGDVVSLASVYIHLIEEYARHCGHADLLREAIDGVREL